MTTSPYNKVFIIGLPRTATTSVCMTFLNLGYKTAHTAYTKNCLAQAQVIADTPVFCDYPLLDQRFPGSKFIYLSRELSAWLPSIQQLLSRMYTNLQRQDGGFNPYLKRCYNEVFSPLTDENITNKNFLTQCYQRHKQSIEQYFIHREKDLLTIDVSHSDSMEKLVNFLDLQITKPIKKTFELINVGGKVTAWNNIKHPLKINSTHNGRIDNALYD